MIFNKNKTGRRKAGELLPAESGCFYRDSAGNKFKDYTATGALIAGCDW
jgi:hypothetical protein